MRITIGLAAIASLCLLAGCNRGAANNSANAPVPTENAPAPAEPVLNEATPAETAAPANGATADRRANEIGECVRSSPGHLPAGTDANAFCTCAVDKMITSGTRQRDAVNQCAAEMRITLPTQG